MVDIDLTPRRTEETFYDVQSVSPGSTEWEPFVTRFATEEEASTYLAVVKSNPNITRPFRVVLVHTTRVETPCTG